MGLLNEFDGECFGGSEDGGIGSNAVAFEVGGFDLVGDGVRGDVSEGEMGCSLDSQGYGKCDGGRGVGKERLHW